MQAQRPGQHPAVKDTPLPGNYPCLTLQLNITRYQSTGAYRLVLVTREPNDHVEVERVADEGFMLSKDEREAVMSVLHSALGTMIYMQGGWTN